MHAMQCVQLLPQEGLPSFMVIFENGQILTHAPHEIHLSVAWNFVVFMKCL